MLPMTDYILITTQLRSHKGQTNNIVKRGKIWKGQSQNR